MDEKNVTLPGPTPLAARPDGTKLPPLWLCIVMDAVGALSYLIPAAGELSDLLWAPVSAFIFFKMFGGRRGLIGSIFNLVEESFPWSDIVPTFTIMWIIEWRRYKRFKFPPGPTQRE